MFCFYTYYPQLMTYNVNISLNETQTPAARKKVPISNTYTVNKVPHVTTLEFTLSYKEFEGQEKPRKIRDLQNHKRQI